MHLSILSNLNATVTVHYYTDIGENPIHPNFTPTSIEYDSPKTV